MCRIYWFRKCTPPVTSISNNTKKKTKKIDPTGSPSQPGSPRAQCEQANRMSPSEQAGLSLIAGRAHSGYCCTQSWYSAETHIKRIRLTHTRTHNRLPSHSYRSVLPSLQSKPVCRWRRIHLSEFSGAKAPSPPGTEGYLESNRTDRWEPLNTIQAFNMSARRQTHLHKYHPCLGFTILTCCTLHTGQPGVYVVTCFGECGLYDGSTEDGCGPSDLGVPMFDEAQHVTDILLLCKETEREQGQRQRQRHK